MPIKLFDRVKQKTITTGSGTVTLGSSVDSFLNFSSVFSDGDQTFYTIEGPTIFEVGLGTYNAGTVSRDIVFKSSNSDQLVNLPGDLNTSIFVTYAASGAVYTTGDRIITNISGVTFPDGNTQTIAYTGQAGGGGGTDWNLSVEGDSTNIGNSETVEFTGQGNITLSRDGNTVEISGSQQDLSSYATTSYVNTVSGGLQSQLTANDTDINVVSGIAQGAADDVTVVSGIAQGASDDVATASGHLQTQITANDVDINTVSGIAQGAAGDVTVVSGIAQGAADDVATVSGLLYNNWNLSITGNIDSITGNETVNITGLGFTSVTYDDATNTIYIFSEGGGSGSGSGSEAIFTEDLLVSLSDGKTFGRYPDGATIPASGKTAREVIQLSIAEPLSPTVNLSSPTSVAFNQTAISNTLNFNHTINSVGASVSSASLEFRRGGVGSWTTLSTSTSTPDSYVHSFTDTNFNTSGMNYRYIVTDSLGASNTGTHNINPASYSSPSISWNLVGNALSGVETNTKRERGNVDSQINGTVTRNSPNVDLISYKIQYRVNGGSWTDIGSSSIGPGSSSIPSTGHDPVANNTATQIQYRIQVVDEYQQHLSSQVTSSTKTINFRFLIFYGALGSAPTTSNGVRAIATQIFNDGSNPFNLNTGSTLKDFTVAMPNTLSISQVLDLDALNANITASYVNNPFNVEDAGGTAVAYNVYTMSNSVPYSSNHRHEITRS